MNEYAYNCDRASFHVETFRTDVQRTNTDFLFTPACNSSFNSFIIVNDSVLEFDELFFAEFDLEEIRSNGWNAREGDIPTTFILIRDDDCELCSDGANHNTVCT